MRNAYMQELYGTRICQHRGSIPERDVSPRRGFSAATHSLHRGSKRGRAGAPGPVRTFGAHPAASLPGAAEEDDVISVGDVTGAFMVCDGYGPDEMPRWVGPGRIQAI